MLPLASMGEDLERWIGQQSSDGEADLETAAELREAFWQGLFDRLRLSLDHDPLDRLTSGEARTLDFAEPDKGMVELLYSDDAAEIEGAIRSWEGDAPPTMGDFLVLRANSPALVREGAVGAMALGRWSLPAGFPQIAERDRDEEPGCGEPPRPARDFLERAFEVEPYFGVRTFDFTAAETVRLLSLHLDRKDASLALVLPGGGVKSAYQSVMIDTLYARSLINREAGRDPDKLAVDHVVGTSGGSLVGYFVARLGAKGPWNLARLLWQDDKGAPLTSAKIFGGTDMLRWLSLVLIYLCLCAVLIVWKHSRWLLESFDAQRLEPSWRVKLSVIVMPIVLLAPLFARQLSGDGAREHVPEIEGFLYAILVWLAMFADQCLVLRADLDQSRPVGLSRLRRGLLAIGIVLVVLPFLLPIVPSLIAKDQQDLGAAPLLLAYGVLTLLGVFSSALIRRLKRDPEAGLAGTVLRAARDYALAAVGTLVVARWGLARIWPDEQALPVFFGGLLLVVLVLGGLLFGLRRGGSREHGVFYWLSLVLGCLLVLLLTGPEKGLETLRDKPWPDWLFLPSGLGVYAGSLVFMSGCLVLLVALLLWLDKDSQRYRFEHVKDFGLGLAITLIHGLAVYALIWGTTLIVGLDVSLLELTGRFWIALVIAALGLAIALLWVVDRKQSGETWLAPLRHGLSFLRGRHPNGTLISWRFLRMALMAVALLGWWNLVVGPALYGNRHALEFLKGAQTRFDTAYKNLYSGTSPRFTATFVTPGNELKTDGARLFVFTPAEASCTAVRNEAGSGARWSVYREAQPSAHARTPRWVPGIAPACTELDAGSAGFLTDVIFASGSPFPVFSAHRVVLPWEGKEIFLVDGGYTHLVPVEPARMLGAEGVLVLRSSHPLGHFSTSGWLTPLRCAAASVPGTLVKNLGRLPAFLFERSQQTDRRSSQALFVVSLSPRREHTGWPSLVDFRTPVVERLQCLARLDLGLPAQGCKPYRRDDDLAGARRIAMVESWGQPKVQLTRKLR